ncbi:Transcription factor [Sporothrix epigloea]|uniref:Transcription factor n=1 Tax=Sporothrix epigloea TaxID=1892477 RepID=A0ABP0DGJ7_9PEZI
MELKKLGKTEHTSEASDWLSKLSVLLVYDFEGAIHLGDWDELESICEMAASCDDPNTLRVFGDTLLRSQALVPGEINNHEEFVSTMRLLVNKLHCADNVGDGKLVQYYLCLFQAALYRDNDAAFQILEEVKRMIDDGLVSETKLNWPEEEIQFLAATAFNEGIDWFAAGREDRVRHWVLSAASLAEQCHDGGKLKSLITSRFNLLKIGDLEIKQSVELDTEGLVPMNSSAITMTAA